MTSETGAKFARGILISGLFLVVLLTAVPRNVQAQGVITFGGTVAAIYSMTDTNNANLAGVLGNFGTLTVGKGTLKSPTPLAIRLRSNAPYKITAQLSGLVGIADGPATPRSTTAQAIKTGDIGFGITAVDVSLTRLVGGGTTPIRTDTISAGFDVRSGFAGASGGHTPNFTKTLHDIFAADTQILSGPRIESQMATTQHEPLHSHSQSGSLYFASVSDRRELQWHGDVYDRARGAVAVSL